MKMKKLMALVLSAVMAVSMLAACGGGGGSMSLGEVNALLDAAKCEAHVSSSSNLTSAVHDVANYLEDMGTFNSSVATARLALIREYPRQVEGNNRVSYTTGAAMVFTDAELKSAGYDSVEEALADAIAQADAPVRAYLDALVQSVGVRYELNYWASATKAVSENKTEYWVLAFEYGIEMSL